jgi:hypothetical protein
MNIITTLLKSKSEERNNEYIDCFKNNDKNKYIKSITILSEDKKVQTLIKNTKIKLVFIDTRPTFRIIIDYINNNFSINETIILTNADIYFDDTLQYINFNKEYAYCLTRWHKYTTDGEWTHAILGACHDTWILKTPIIIDNIDFGLGVLGCDSRFSYQTFDAGYLPINPSHLIKCYHLHVSNLRIWRRENILCGNYLGIDPTKKVEYIKENIFTYNGQILRGKYTTTEYDYIFKDKYVKI